MLDNDSKKYILSIIMRDIFRPEVIKLRKKALPYLYKLAYIIKDSDYYKEYNENNKELEGSKFKFLYVSFDMNDLKYSVKTDKVETRPITDFMSAGAVPTFISDRRGYIVKDGSSPFLPAKEVGLKRIVGSIEFTKEEKAKIEKLNKEFKEKVITDCIELASAYKIIEEETWKILEKNDERGILEALPNVENLFIRRKDFNPFNDAETIIPDDTKVVSWINDLIDLN